MCQNKIRDVMKINHQINQQTPIRLSGPLNGCFSEEITVYSMYNYVIREFRCSTLIGNREVHVN